MFADREDAGQQLAERLQADCVEADLVLAIPRGGLPLGRAVADALGAPLDVVVARKIGAPFNPELAIGAVASDGTVWRNEDVIDDHRIGDDYVSAEAETEAENAREKLVTYRGTEAAPDVDGLDVVLVDDGVATGATAMACIRQLQENGVASVTMAVPVGPGDTLTMLEDMVDTVICLERPDRFYAVGQVYDDFTQVTDEEARTYLSDSTDG